MNLLTSGNTSRCLQDFEMVEDAVQLFSSSCVHDDSPFLFSVVSTLGFGFYSKNR